MHKYFANTTFIGKQIVSLPSCHSTNDILANLVPKKELFEGAVVIADHQTAGRGQRGNTWEAAPGKNLTFSVLLKPQFLDVEEQFYLNMVISLGIASFLSDYLSAGVSIKWPNDIYYYDQKLGGILIENSLRKQQIEHAIIGVGLNINQRNFRSEGATSLAAICDQEFALDELLHQLLASIESKYLQLRKNGYKALKKEYLSKLYWLDEEHIFKAEDFFSGKIIGIDAIGRLKVETSDGLRVFSIKEIAFIR